MKKRLNEINARLAEISGLIDTAEGDTLSALETEVRTLTMERDGIMSEIRKRSQMRAKIAAGTLTGTVLEGDENDVGERRYTPDSAAYREAYLLNLQSRTLTAEQRAAVTASAAIPTQTMNRIIGYMETSPILSLIDMTYIPGNVTFPVEENCADASWVAMGTASTDSSDTLTAVTLGAYMLVKTIEITADVKAMSIDAFEDWLVARLGNKLEKALRAAVFNGTGTNQATGICKTISANTGTFTQAKATYDDIIKILAALGSEPAMNATFAMQRKLYFSDVLGITDDAGKPICHTDVESPAKYNILGYPVALDDNVPADTILFGDFKMYKMNLAQMPEVTSDDSVGFRSGSRVYRAMALADGKLAMESAFVRFGRAEG